MARKPIGPTFDFDTTRTDRGSLYSVWVNGKAPLSGGGGTYIGRVWQNEELGWVAARPLADGTADSWSQEVDRSVRYFARRKDACIYLYGVMHGIGSVKVREEMKRTGLDRALTA